jgi:hypothetical protein
MKNRYFKNYKKYALAFKILNSLRSGIKLLKNQINLEANFQKHMI